MGLAGSFVEMGGELIENLRLRIAVGAASMSAWAIRRLGRGAGNALPGRILLLLYPRLIGARTGTLDTAVVSGTNGKTTTTALLRATLGGEGVISNSDGSNMDFGVALALGRGLLGGAIGRTRAALEVDEAYVPSLAQELGPKVIALLNLSRDQLDRNSEVRQIAEKWRGALLGLPKTTVVANADDPLVVYGVEGCPQSVFVAGGMRWRWDAIACPKCERQISYAPSGWSCECGFARPQTLWSLDKGNEVTRDGSVLGRLELRIPGEFNARNALFALAATEIMEGTPFDPSRFSRAVTQLGSVGGVGGRFGRFRTSPQATEDIFLMLAKNPAGWQEMLSLFAEQAAVAPLVLGLNAQIADGRDTSWIWDVDFEELVDWGPGVIVTGERCLDMAVRLASAGVVVHSEPSQIKAVQLALEKGSPVTYLGNYTAFQQLRKVLYPVVEILETRLA